MSLRSNLLVLILILGVQGCSLRSSSPPDIPDSTITHLLVELQLAGARAELEGDVPPHYRDSLLQVYGVDSSRFHQLMMYYATHPDEARERYNRVLDMLQEEHARLDTLD